MNNIFIILLLFNCYFAPFFWNLKDQFKIPFICFLSTGLIFLIHPFILIPLFSSAIMNYFFGLLLDRLRSRLFLASFIFINFLFCLFFKETLQKIDMGSILNDHLFYNYGDFLLVLGISFYFLQSLSYLTDVFKKEIQAKKNFFMFYNYLSFFPKFIQGPIEKPKNFFDQVTSFERPKENTFLYGLLLIFSGLFRKLLLSELYYMISHTILEEVEKHGTLIIFIGVVSLNIKIYYDFSGYTRIARGVALLFGIRLTENFKEPFFSSNFFEFWKNWHHSFFNWVRDYVFVPCYDFLRKVLATKITFIISIFSGFLFSAIWHGGSIYFIIFFCLHAVFLLMSFPLRELKFRIYKKLKFSYAENVAFRFLNILIVFFFWSLTSISLAYIDQPEIHKKIISSFFYSFQAPLSLSLSDFSPLFLKIDIYHLFSYKQIFFLLFLSFISLYFEYIKKFRGLDILKHNLLKKSSFLALFFTANIWLLIIFSPEKGFDFIYSAF